MTTIARSNAMTQRPLKTETHRVESDAVESLKRYLQIYHPRSYWLIRSVPHDTAVIFESSKSLADVVYAFLCGRRSVREGWEDDDE